jgi:hypothetical protein
MSTLEILGKSPTGTVLWVRIDGKKGPVTLTDLAIARRSVSRGYSGRLSGHWVDEEQVTTLIKAMDAPQPLYPTRPCRDCGTGASHLIEGDPYCHVHAAEHTQ